MTAGEPELSSFTPSSWSSAGPVIWLRWSRTQSGSSIRQSPCASDSGRYAGLRPACEASRLRRRAAMTPCWRAVNVSWRGR